MAQRTIIRGITLLLLSGGLAAPSAAEEIYFQDGKRLMAMVEAVSRDGKMTLRLPTGRLAPADLTQVNAISFRGREARAIRAGAQEFHFVSGDRLKGQLVALDGDTLVTETSATGKLAVPLSSLRGFLTMPVEGKAGRRATELVTGDDDEPTGKMDQVLDRRAAGYEGIIEEIDSKELRLDHERLRKIVPLNVLHLAGVRLARDAQDPRPPLPQQPFIKIHSRDQSSLDGLLESVQHGKWNVRPLWQTGRVLSVPVDEIVTVEVLNGQAIYLSQLEPRQVTEKTILAPGQRYRLNQNCLGNPISVAGILYTWGIGVHAHSSLTFDIGGRWSRFESVLGIDDQVGTGGSVVFRLVGDGKELYRSPVIRGGAAEPTAVAIPVKGVQQLTLVVEATDDLDLGDAANWAGARLVR
jgi:hypothetical protein